MCDDHYEYIVRAVENKNNNQDLGKTNTFQFYSQKLEQMWWFMKSDF